MVPAIVLSFRTFKRRFLRWIRRRQDYGMNWTVHTSSILHHISKANLNTVENYSRGVGNSADHPSHQGTTGLSTLCTNSWASSQHPIVLQTVGDNQDYESPAV